MANLVVLYSRYDQNKYPNSLNHLQQALAPLYHWQHSILIVDNMHTDRPFSQLQPCLYLTGGDDSVHEFTAWDKGLRLWPQQFEEPELWMLATDAFPAYGNDYSQLLNDQILTLLAERNYCAGLIDPLQPGSVPLQLFDWRFEWWVRTSFMIIPAPIMRQLESPITFHNPNQFVHSSYQEPYFLDDAPFNQAYQDKIVQWLTQDWHSAFEPDELSWGKFSEKVRSILNEHALTCRIRDLEAGILDLNFLSQFRKNSKQDLLADETTLLPYVMDPAEQVRTLRPSLIKRIVNKVSKIVS